MKATTNMETDDGTDQLNSDSPSGFDSILQTIESYIQAPSTVTRQTLSQLKADVMDLKDYFENESQNEPSQDQSQTGMSELMNKVKGGR